MKITMKTLVCVYFCILFTAFMNMTGCLQQSSHMPEEKTILNADTVQSEAYPSVVLPNFKIIKLEKLPTIIMGKKVAFNTLCLIEKEDPEEPIKTWCIACDTSMIVRFVENYHEEPHSLLLIKKDTIVLDKMQFQIDDEQNNLVGEISYSFSCNDIKQIFLNQDSFLTFTADIFMCNGSGCGYSFEFLYHVNARQLYVFDHFRGSGYFGDINQDLALDYMELSPKSSDILDTVALRFYTLNVKKRVFEPLKDEKGAIKVLWLAAIGKDIYHDYRFSKKLSVIPPSTAK